jgi:HD-like signal output (HDOD) protein
MADKQIEGMNSSVDDQIKKILSEHNELVSLPQTLSEVLRVVKNESSSAQDLAKVLMRDPALTAKVLRIVNSPYYGARREISTVNQAVVTLGTRQVTALALSTSLYNVANNWTTEIDRIRFWRHSLEVAIGCRMIAEKIRYANVEEAFVSGLLHDLGMLVLEKSYSNQFKKVYSKISHGESVIDLEEEAWGTNHARVGQFLFEQWNLPGSICQAVGHHHDLFAPETTNPELILSQIVCLANDIAQFSVYDLDTTVVTVAGADNREIIKQNIKLSSGDLYEIQKELLSATMREAKFLEIEIGTPEELVEEANRMLFAQYLTVENLLTENRKLRRQVTQSRVQEVAKKSLGSLAVELNKYINNAVASMRSRISMIQIAINEARLAPQQRQLCDSVQSVGDSVETLGQVLKDLTNLASLDTSMYENDSSILDLEERIKHRLEQLDIMESSIAG